MQWAFTGEQQEFRQVLRRYFQEVSPTPTVRRLMETEAGWERAAWRELNDTLGLCGVHVPEIYGGQGFGFVELGIVLEEMGRALVCAPFFASVVLATTAILNGASEAQKAALLPPLALGETIATLAFTEPNGRWDFGGVETTATPLDGGRYRLDGVKSFVLDGHTADLILVLARRPGSAGDEGLSLFAARAGAAGLERRPLTALDPTRKIALLSFDGVEAELLGEAEAAAGPMALTLAQAATCLASESVGGAEKLRESALDYAMLRIQFGRPIAALQSMKHKQADMLVEVELARSAAYAASAAADDDGGRGGGEFMALASLAKASASEAYLQTALHTIQIHGGIGFTWENDTHLWFKRAKSSEVFLGDPTWRREQMMRAWGH
ncbi:acyl-CoA dehydrogenase family protein [Caulobacter sp. KR2-114]|uniref:acyl-CoA dehydrogenase family protein n=1 Tax=Caulobacter sp. KR2-114 TaxID=3400912 RepID=UPI003C0ADE5D